LKDFTTGVLQGKIIAIVTSRGETASNVKCKRIYIFTLPVGKEKVDIYVRNKYLQEEVYDPDIPDFIQGIFAATILCTALLFRDEKKRQAREMQRQFESKNAELRKALEEREALALLGRMTATLAHELKTPLATLSNLIHVLPSRISDEKFTGRFTAMAKEELQRTRELIDNLLIYGKEITLKNRLWIGLKDFIAGLAPAAGIRIVSCPEVELFTDRFFMRLLFENLIRNSLQAGAGEISIRVDGQSKEGPSVDILFEDDGAGFPGECDLEELVSPFITLRSRGAGLGLYLAQKIALAHGGALSLYRREKGAGVIISFPRETVKWADTSRI
ncbi:MAG TPA: HAMP domain-containing sensor histidine kinase, partial [Dissulfurispiraceae bacterium]